MRANSRAIASCLSAGLCASSCRKSETASPPACLAAPCTASARKAACSHCVVSGGGKASSSTLSNSHWWSSRLSGEVESSPSRHPAVSLPPNPSSAAAGSTEHTPWVCEWSVAFSSSRHTQLMHARACVNSWWTRQRAQPSRSDASEPGSVGCAGSERSSCGQKRRARCTSSK
ncbi:hypothetical protein T492DRAFT_1023905 [Pavlovales sp. CCMP2436]|nr:hypothetical protein T492DRAFT_1023905 [Pavlovales sp. CCMP2436]